MCVEPRSCVAEPCFPGPAPSAIGPALLSMTYGYCLSTLDLGGWSLQVSINTKCSFVRDVLRGSDVSELRLKLLSLNKEEYPFKDDD